MLWSDENESSGLKHNSMSKDLLREELRAVVLLVAVVVFDGDKVWWGCRETIGRSDALRVCASGSGGCLVIA
jgi:hypothetical protein